MGNVNMEAYQVHYSGDKSVADKLKELDAIAQQIEDLPTFTSDDRVFLEAVPAMPAAEGKTVLTAITDDQGETELTYETPEVESEDIAPEFSEEVAYGEGDLVYYEGILYKFTADHAAGAWDPSEVTQTTVAAEFNALKNTLNYKTPRINLSAITSTSVKDFLTKMCQQIQGLTLTNYVIYTSFVERVGVDYFSVMFARTASKAVVFLAIPGASTELYTGQLTLNGTISAYRYGGTAI